MRIGYSNWGMPKVPIEEAIPAVARMGYQGLEITVSPQWCTELAVLDKAKSRRIRELMDEHHLTITGVIRNASMVEQDVVLNAANMKELRESVDLAAEWAQPGEPSVMISVLGGKTDEWENQRNLALERLIPLADYAAERNVFVALELHVGGLLDRPERVVWFFEQAGHPAVRLNFDISHMEVMGYTIDQSVPLLAPLSIHTHVKDQRGRYPNFEFLTPGEGPFDFVHYLRAMQATGYNGFVTAEVSVMVQRRPDYDPFFHAQLAYWTLYKAFQVAGLPIGK
jgi:sugar phosphate isomerase/epimerase